MENLDNIVLQAPITEKEKKDFKAAAEKLKESAESDFAFDVDAAGSQLCSALKDGISYIESIPLNAHGEIDSESFMDNAGRNLLERAKSVSLDKKGLAKFTRAIEEKFKNIKITLKEDGGELVLKAENKIKKNSFVHWVSQGASQWTEPKRVVHISDDGQYAFFDGSMTGVPIQQLEIEE